MLVREKRADDPPAEIPAAKLTGRDPAVRLGLAADAGVDAERIETLQRLEAWRIPAAHPLTDRVTADACEIVAQSYERLYAELPAGSG